MIEGPTDLLPLLLALLSAFVCFDCASRIASYRWPYSLAWASGSALAFSTASVSLHLLWVHASEPIFPVGYHPVLLITTWVLGVLCSLPAWWLLFIAPHSLMRRMAGCALLGATLVASQSVALLAPGFLPGLQWEGLAMLMDWGAMIMAMAIASWVYLAATPLVGSRSVRLLAASAIMGFALWWSSFHLTAQSNWLQQTETAYAGMVSLNALTLLASLGTLLLLLMTMLISLMEARMQTSLKKVQGTLEKQHLTDPLTQLPNRAYLESSLPEAARQADENHRSLSLMLLNLDGFKPINESFGHRFGDLLLQEVSRRLMQHAGEDSRVVRWAADEFIVLGASADGRKGVASIARRLLDSLKAPLIIEGREVPLAASIGIAIYPQDGAHSMLITHADAAARSAKGSGGDSYCFFEPRMLQDIREQMDLLRDLKVALDRSQLELYFQPKVHAPSGQITGAEALLRWNHPTRGLISPTVFIPIAERFGMINNIGNWVIQEACRQIREWRDGGLRMRVAINLSVHQMRQPDLADRIASTLAAHDINPRLLTCEITESVAMEDAESTKLLFARLEAVGVHLSIDDFGTGYSSLSYLRQLPAEELKIDRSFVVDIEHSDDARAVVDAVIKLGVALDLKVVAEGVETDGQFQVLRQLGCDELQGFLFARPMTAKMLFLWATMDRKEDDQEFRPSLFADTQMHPLGEEAARREDEASRHS